MGWAQWRVPELTEEDQLALRVLQLRLRETQKHSPEALLGLCLTLAEQCRVKDNIINKASERIAVLEMSQAIAEPAAHQEHPLPRRWRWWRRGGAIVRALVLGQ